MNRRLMAAWAGTILVVMVLAATSAFAQPGPPMLDEQQQEKLRQRIEMMRIWKLTELLDLDEESATEFLPRYRSYITDVDSLDRELRELDARVDAGLSGEEMNFDDLLKQSFELEKQQFERRQRFFRDSADLLDTQQQVALMLFERRFHQRLREMVHEVQREEGPPHRHRGGRGSGHGMGP